MGDRKRSPSIAVVGDYMDDVDRYYVTTRDRAPDGEFPVVKFVRDDRRSGGAGAVANMAEAMGARVTRVGVVIRAPGKVRHIVDGKILFREDRETTVPIARELAERMILAIGDDVSVILVADYGKGIVSNRMWEGLSRLQARIIVDPSADRDYPGAWAIMPGIRELPHIETLGQAAEIATNYLHHYPRVAVKLAERGMVVAGREEPQYLPRVFPALCDEPVDTCGAGDMVLAAAGVAVSHGCEWLEACDFASKMAAAKCRRWGAVPVGFEEAGIRPPWE